MRNERTWKEVIIIDCATGQPISVNRLICELRNIANARGKITQQRAAIIMQAADKLEELDERIAIMQEGNGLISWERTSEECSGNGSIRTD